MSFEFLTRIPTSDEIVSQYPITPEMAAVKARRDEAIRRVIIGESDQFLLVIGPCSADNEDAVCEYVGRLGLLQHEVADRLILIPRIYTNKPRTTGEGYKGILHQPDPEKEPDMVGGLIALRKMHLRALRESGLSAADETLYPENHTYLDDVLSYIAIGARSVENQQHRLTASGIAQPVGMKNPTSGDFQVMLNSVYAAQKGHVFNYQGWAVRTTGNPLAHTVLRGSMNKHGQNQPNYHFEDLKLLWQFYQVRDPRQPGLPDRHQPFQLRQELPRAAAHRDGGAAQPQTVARSPATGQGFYDRELSGRAAASRSAAMFSASRLPMPAWAGTIRENWC